MANARYLMSCSQPTNESNIRRLHHVTWLLALAIFLLLAPAAVTAERVTFKAERLSLTGLVGTVRIASHEGPDFEVDVELRGEDARRIPIDIVASEGESAELVIHFPTDQVRDYVYPERGALFRTSITAEQVPGAESSWFTSFLRQVTSPTVEIRGSGSGAEVWADVSIMVPRGKDLEVALGTGIIRADGLDASLSLDMQVGEVALTEVRGPLRVANGVGDVEIRNAVVDGRVEVKASRGDLQVRGLRAVAGGSIQTGSGDVEVEVLTLEDRLTVETGSGEIAARVGSTVRGEVSAQTGRGGVDARFASADWPVRKENRVRVRLGDGTGELRLQTGSGEIKIRSTR